MKLIRNEKQNRTTERKKIIKKFPKDRTFEWETEWKWKLKEIS